MKKKQPFCTLNEKNAYIILIAFNVQTPLFTVGKQAYSLQPCKNGQQVKKPCTALQNQAREQEARDKRD